MFFRILVKDLKRKKTMNVILLLFIILAAMFLAGSVDNLIAVNGAIDHFLSLSNMPMRFNTYSCRLGSSSLRTSSRRRMGYSPRISL